MPKMPKIEPGVDIPPQQYNKKRRLRYLGLLMKLQLGDSFTSYVPMNFIMGLATELGIELTARYVNDKYRYWRVL